MLVEFAPQTLRAQREERRYEFANGAVVARLELDEGGDVVAVGVLELELRARG